MKGTVLKRKWVIGTVLALLVLAGAATKVSAVEAGDNQVFFFENTNYGGASMSFEYDKLVPDLTKWKLTNSKLTWNDRISSIKVGKNAKVILFADINYKGDTITLLGTGSHGVGNFPTMPSGWNDKVSSFKVVMGDIQ
jgi:hypothetical protein